MHTHTHTHTHTGLRSLVEAGALLPEERELLLASAANSQKFSYSKYTGTLTFENVSSSSKVLSAVTLYKEKIEKKKKIIVFALLGTNSQKYSLQRLHIANILGH